MTTIREKLNAMKEILNDKKEILEKLNEEIDQLSDEIKETEQNLLKNNDPEFIIEKLKEYDLIKIIMNNFDCEFNFKEKGIIETTIDFGSNERVVFADYNHDVGRRENSTTVSKIFKGVIYHYIMEVVDNNSFDGRLKDFLVKGAKLHYPMFDGLTCMGISLGYEHESKKPFNTVHKKNETDIPIEISIEPEYDAEIYYNFYAEIGKVDINDKVFNAINILFSLKSEQVENIIKTINEWVV